MLGVGVFEVDGGVAGEANGIVDAGGVEVGVVERSVDEDGAGGDEGQNIAEIEGHGLGTAGGDAGHIAFVRPAGEVAAIVFPKAREAAGRDDGAEATIESGDEEGIVAAEGVAADADAARVDKRETGEETDATHVVFDALDGGARVAVRVGVELVFAEVGIVGGQCDEAAQGELAGVVQAGLAAETGGLVLADAGGLVEAEDGGEFLAGGIGRQQQPGRDVTNGEVAAEKAAVEGFRTSAPHGELAGAGGKWTHDLFEAAKRHILIVWIYFSAAAYRIWIEWCWSRADRGICMTDLSGTCTRCTARAYRWTW